MLPLLLFLIGRTSQREDFHIKEVVSLLKEADEFYRNIVLRARYLILCSMAVLYWEFDIEKLLTDNYRKAIF